MLHNRCNHMVSRIQHTFDGNIQAFRRICCKYNLSGTGAIKKTAQQLSGVIDCS